MDVLGAARAFEINVYADILDKNVSGILRRDEKIGGPSGWVILVNRAHHLNRQRFTAAHEIGHFLLHRSQLNAGIEDDEFYRALPGPLEREANAFAADLLMPWSLINSLRDAGVADLPSMAARLAVSKQALAIRLGLPYDSAGWE